MKKLYILPLILLFISGACLGAASDLQVLADKYNRLVDQPLTVSIKPELYSVKYDLRKNLVEVKLTDSFYQSKSNSSLFRKIEKYEPTLIFDSGIYRFAMSYRI
jgi:hypothetical protein